MRSRLWVWGLAVCCCATYSFAADPEFQFKPVAPNDKIVAIPEAKRTLFLITTERGIGRASIQLKAGDWPEHVTLRFQFPSGKPLRGLERIDLTTDRLEVQGSQKQSGKFDFCFLDAQQTPVELQLGHKPAGVLNITVELRDEGMNVILPAHFLTGSQKLELYWIDFYRN